MGRQITLYCSDATFELLEPIPGETTSAKIRTAVQLWDAKQQKTKDYTDARIETLKRQIETLKDVLRANKIKGWWSE